MRVLVAASQWYPDRRSGFARVVTETARRLARRGHEITVLAPRADGRPAEVQEGSLTLLRVIERDRLPLTLTDVVRTRTWARRFHPGRFDVLLAHGPGSAIALSRARLEAPLALVFHASHLREIRFERARLPLGRRRLATYALEPVLALLERWALERADRVLVLSEFSRSLLSTNGERHARRALAVAGGVDAEFFSPGDGPGPARARLGLEGDVPLLLTVRRLEPRMGLDRLLLAVGVLAAAREIRLAIVGGGALEGQLRRLRDDLGLGDRVRFVGQVPDSELRDWYRAADLFVLPTVAYEGFGMVTAEALACGTPVVGTPVGATPELLEPLDPRLVATGSDARALTAAIEQTLGFADASLRRRCREYARKHLSWEIAIQSWERALAVEQPLGPPVHSSAQGLPVAEAGSEPS